MTDPVTMVRGIAAAMRNVEEAIGFIYNGRKPLPRNNKTIAIAINKNLNTIKSKI
ncbi:hypothetical protein HKX68_13140 [Dickeya dadantii]|nr:hypothetical protein [Dickeya dadantii]NPE63829.1 hypothetical protein [Dickeya dadantii]